MKAIRKKPQGSVMERKHKLDKILARMTPEQIRALAHHIVGKGKP
jgi:hypothetical protein